MKKYLLLVAMILATFAFAFTAQAEFINDTYWGGQYYNGPNQINGGVADSDIYGADFDVSGANVTRSGSTLTVKIEGIYFQKRLLSPTVSSAPSYGPGDLFLSSGWSKTGSSPYAADIFTFAEGWKYAVTDTGIYALTNGSWSTTTDAGPGYPGNHREYQAWLNTSTNKVGDIISYSIDETGVQYVFDLSGLALGDVIGLHWTMKCGNDVFEGGTQVPEPGTMILVGLGILGLAGLRRRA